MQGSTWKRRPDVFKLAFILIFATRNQTLTLKNGELK